MFVLTSELTSALLGLASAALWGTGDYFGGVASKRSHAVLVVLLSLVIGAVFLMSFALVLGEPLPVGRDLVYGALAGAAGSLGLVALFSGLARGPMGVVAPVSSVVAAVLPVLVAAFTEGIPDPPKLLGFTLALLAIWLLSSDASGQRFRAADLVLPVAAGLGFGVFMVLIGLASEGAVLWPLLASKASSISLMLLIALVSGASPWPGWKRLPLVAVTGILDSSGNALYALAAKIGRLDVAAVLASLTPATTVFLAWLIAKERLSIRQRVGVGMALAAVLLIAS
jgi:drug/metabolite transporter (DMT)-like permease